MAHLEDRAAGWRCATFLQIYLVDAVQINLVDAVQGGGLKSTVQRCRHP